MGRVTNDYSSATTTGSPLQVNHFSHPHPLLATPPSNNQAYSPTISCSGCKLQTSGQITYTCTPCAFTLHQSCATLPRLITHPSHPTCTLTLITHPSYPGGVFNCDACTRQGTTWGYHCTRCDYDLHVTCASKPLKIRHVSHTTCHLDLTFKNPYPDASGFSCDACGSIGSKQWLYRCHTCGFDVHLDCTTTPQRQRPPPLQHHHSMPASMNSPLHHHQNNADHLTHSTSAGQFVGQGPGQVIGYGPGSQNVGRVQNANQQPMGVAGGVGNNLMMAAVQGFVEGAFQSVGQAVVQDVIASGGDFGGGAGADIGGGAGTDFGGGSDGSTY